MDHKDLNASQKRWLIVGVCLHSIMSPQLRRFIEPEVKKLYNAMVTAHQIDTQTLPNILEKYPPPNGYRLNYQSINNNTVYGRNFRNFDYKVKDDIDFSKLFLLPHMAHYTGFDESCDSSALLGLILNIQGFQPALRNVIDKVKYRILLILIYLTKQYKNRSIFVFWIWVLRPVKIISFILSRFNRKVGRKREIPEKSHLTTRKQNLACLTYDPS